MRQQRRQVNLCLLDLMRFLSLFFRCLLHFLLFPGFLPCESFTLVLDSGEPERPCGVRDTLRPVTLPEAVGAAPGCPSPSCKVQVRGNPAGTPSGQSASFTHVGGGRPLCVAPILSWGGDGAAP